MRADSVAALEDVIGGSWLMVRSSIGPNPTELKGGNFLRKVASDCACLEQWEREPSIGQEIATA